MLVSNRDRQFLLCVHHRIYYGKDGKKMPVGNLVALECHDFIPESQTIRLLFEACMSDGAAKEIAMPCHRRLRFDGKELALDLEIMPFARPHDEAMHAEADRLGIPVRRRVNDAYVAHICLMSRETPRCRSFPPRSAGEEFLVERLALHLLPQGAKDAEGCTKRHIRRVAPRADAPERVSRDEAGGARKESNTRR